MSVQERSLFDLSEAVSAGGKEQIQSHIRGVTDIEDVRRKLAEERTGQLVIMSPNVGYVALSVLYEQRLDIENPPTEPIEEGVDAAWAALALF